MTLYPAIDLKDGKAVRLTKGLMDSAKIYSDEPWQLVKKFEEIYAKLALFCDHNFKYKIIFIDAPICSKAKEAFISLGWKIK